MRKQPSKSVLKICSKFTREHPCRSVISIKLLCKFTEITLRHECSPVNLLNIFRTDFHRNASGGLHLFVSTIETTKYLKLQSFKKKQIQKSFYKETLRQQNAMKFFRLGLLLNLNLQYENRTTFSTTRMSHFL